VCNNLSNMSNIFSIIIKTTNMYWFVYIKRNIIINYIRYARKVTKKNCHQFCYYLIRNNKWLYKKSVIIYNKKYNNFFFNKYVLKNNYSVFFYEKK
jgi:hypothetical protein